MVGLASDFSQAAILAHIALLLISYVYSTAVYLVWRQWKKSRGAPRTRLERWLVPLHIGSFCLMFLILCELFVWSALLLLERDALPQPQALLNMAWGLAGLFVVAGGIAIANGSSLNLLLHMGMFRTDNTAEQNRMTLATMQYIWPLIAIGAIAGRLAPGLGIWGDILVATIEIAVGLLMFLVTIITAYQLVILLRHKVSIEPQPESIE
jgi:hypothetical protein